MGSLIVVAGFSTWLSFFNFSFISVDSQTVGGTVFIDGRASIGRIDSDFICATMDWWPPEKCDYGTCSWDHASLLNLDLNNKIFFNAVKALSPLKIRLGGTLQDKVIYETEDHQQPCIQFAKNTSELFGFTEGCLPLSRWDELNTFFNESGALVIFGLNALYGRSIQPGGSAVGAWNSANAESFMRYTVKKGYTIYGWELGNELSGNGVGVRIGADQYASDTISLHNMVQGIYKDITEPKPLIMGPGGFFDPNWYQEFLVKTTKSLDITTHHIYNLGPGVDEHLVEKILNSSYLDREAATFSRLQGTLKSTATSATAWVGEAGGAYNSGRNLVTNAFVFSFWYLDQLGMASAYDTKTYCRQSLIGGNYGLLSTNFVPNPDYFSALLWHQLMGRNVLSASFSGTKNIRAYAHCAKSSQGIVLLLLNLDSTTTVQVETAFTGTTTTTTTRFAQKRHKSHNHRTKTVQIAGGNKMMGGMAREEYHLTAKDGSLHSQMMLLNGNILAVDSAGNLPPLEPVSASSSEPITVAPFSIVFAHIPDVVLSACNN